MEHNIALFREVVWDYYRHHGRTDLPWRHPEPDGAFDPYKILVSELMLQQTQVLRVVPKYHEFLERFPSVQALAAASLGDVLAAWSGLGYNRRAKFLWQAAQKIEQELGGVFPRTMAGLVALPGVGKNTAGAILAYAFNQPTVFIETNIRTVLIHHFFKDADQVPDGDVYTVVAACVDTEEPRSWYWALMDYGTYLKQTVGNLGRVSKHYTKQSKFEGSRRQIRGQIIRMLVQSPCARRQLEQECKDERLGEVLTTLTEEGLVCLQGDRYTLS